VSRAPQLERDFIEASVSCCTTTPSYCRSCSGCGQKPAEFHQTILEFDTLINVTLHDVDEQLANEVNSRPATGYT
jgi:hypothetical protein